MIFSLIEVLPAEHLKSTQATHSAIVANLKPLQLFVMQDMQICLRLLNGGFS